MQDTLRSLAKDAAWAMQDGLRWRSRVTMIDTLLMVSSSGFEA